MVIFSSPYKTVELRNPLISDSGNVLRDVLVNLSRGGRSNVILQKGTSRKGSECIISVLNFEHIKWEKVEEFYDFLRYSGGKDIIFIDYNQQAWHCIFITDSLEFSSSVRGQYEKGRRCKDSLLYDFQVTIKKWR